MRKVDSSIMLIFTKKIRKSMIRDAKLENNAPFYLRFFAAPLRALREVS